MKRPPGPTMLDRPRRLRRDMTEAEILLWTRLRSRQMGGFKFRRQMWLCGYVADFACVEAHLVIEADGGQHDAAQGEDARRTAALAAEGYRVLRFWNHDILANLDGVLLTIRDALSSPSHPAAPGRPLTLPDWERGL